MDRRFCAALAALVLALSGCGGGDGDVGASTSAPAPAPSPTPTPTPSPSPSPSPSPTPTGDIPRDIKVAFIGSSVVNGVGASTTNASLTARVAQYLDTRFRTVDARVFAANRTDAEFGAYRIDSDLGRAGFVPDYAFVSFTNDTEDAAAIRTFQDAIIYKLRQKNPNVVVILVAVTRENDENERRANVVPARVAATRDLATTEGAGVGFVDAGAALWDKVINGGQPLSSLLANGFPTDAGYKVYADAITAFLDTRVATLTGSATTSAYIADTRLQDAQLLNVSSATGNSCSAFTGSTDIYLSPGLACTAGQGFSLTFTGTTLGVTRATVADGGSLSCTVDGGLPKVVSFYEAAVDMTALRPMRVFENLPNATHQMTCTVAATSPPGSTGSRVVIGSFFVSSGRLLPG